MDIEHSLSLKFAALADPTRRAILARLALGDATVTELHRPFEISQPAVSKHLKVLETAGLIAIGHTAQSRPRRLNVEALKEAIDWFDRVETLWQDSFDRLGDFLASAPDPTTKDQLVPDLKTDAPTAPEFVISRTFAAPRARLWEAWTQPEQMVRWLGPKGTTGSTKAADVRPGGLLHWRMEGPDGGVMWGRAVYREVIEPSRLVYVQSFSDEGGNVARAPFFEGRWPMEMLTTVTFEDDGTGTRVTLTWSPLGAAPDEQANFVFNIPSMRGGWGNSFDQLETFLADGPRR